MLFVRSDGDKLLELDNYPCSTFHALASSLYTALSCWLVICDIASLCTEERLNVNNNNNRFGFQLHAAI